MKVLSKLIALCCAVCMVGMVWGKNYNMYGFFEGDNKWFFIPIYGSNNIFFIGDQDKMDEKKNSTLIKNLATEKIHFATLVVDNNNYNLYGTTKAHEDELLEIDTKDEAADEYVIAIFLLVKFGKNAAQTDALAKPLFRIQEQFKKKFEKLKKKYLGLQEKQREESEKKPAETGAKVSDKPAPTDLPAKETDKTSDDPALYALAKTLRDLSLEIS